MLETPDGWLATLARLAVAAALGGVIGWEREGAGRTAGLRTHMLVALGSAAFIIIGLEIAEIAAGTASASIDATRVLSGLVGGVGFLGAGAIIEARGKVRGLTTAAGIWLCAALGAAAGAALYQIAVLSAGVGLAVLVLMAGVKRFIHEHDGADEAAGAPDPNAETRAGD